MLFLVCRSEYSLDSQNVCLASLFIGWSTVFLLLFLLSAKQYFLFVLEQVVLQGFLVAPNRFVDAIPKKKHNAKSFFALSAKHRRCFLLRVAVLSFCKIFFRRGRTFFSGGVCVGSPAEACWRGGGGGFQLLTYIRVRVMLEIHHNMTDYGVSQ